MPSRAATRKKSAGPGERYGSSIALSIEDYLTACRARGVRATTVRNAYGAPLRRRFLPWLQEKGIQEPGEITQRVVDGFMADLRDKDLSENTVWTYGKSVRQYVGWLREQDGGPEVRVQLRVPPARQVEVLEREDIRRIERVAGTERDRVIVRLLADTGMRPGELCSIAAEGLRRDSRRCYVRVTGKTGVRDVPVEGELWRRMRALGRGEHDPVFVSIRRDPRTKEFEPLTPHGVSQIVAKLAEEAGLRQRVTAYTFRHSACRWLLLGGLSTVEVEKILGHGSDRMIRLHYNNIGLIDAHDRLIQLLRKEA